MGEVHLSAGDKARAVLVGGRDNPKGAVLVASGAAGGGLQAAPLAQQFALLSPVQVVEILCMQERAFGDSALPAPQL